jgi:hypothetical protein
LIYGLEPEILGGDGKTFTLAEKQAALVALKAWQARTWGEFARVASTSLSALIDGWGEEIVELYGRRPTRQDAFSFGEYAGNAYFADVVTDPRQAAFDAVVRNPRLRGAFKAAGFDLQYGFPGFPGVEAISFEDERLIEPLCAATGIIIEKDAELLVACLPH